MKTLLKYDLVDWLKERPVNLLQHVQELCNLDNTPKHNFLLAKIIEQIYACRNRRLVLPLAFRENLIAYKMSNAPLLSALNGASKPSGAQTFLNNWLKDAASKPITVPPGLIRIVFDNEQVIGKRYRVKAKQMNVPMSVITSHAYITLSKTNDMQYKDDENIPSKWMFACQNDSIDKKIIDSFETHKYIFRKTRNEFIQHRLNVILKEMKDRENGYELDVIDEMLREKVMIDTYKVCQNCDKLAPIKDRVCKACKGTLIRQKPSQRQRWPKKRSTHTSILTNSYQIPTNFRFQLVSRI